MTSEENKPKSEEMMDDEQDRVDKEKASKPSLPGIGHNIDEGISVAGKRLQSFIERIERLQEEKEGMAEDIREIYKESKGVGFDTKALRKIVSLRKMDTQKRHEEAEILDLYKASIGMM